MTRKLYRPHTEALSWLTKAAQQGEAFAVNNIGVIHQFGHEVDVDIDKAIGLYTLAAWMGAPIARTNLANLGVAVPVPDLQPRIADTNRDAELAVMLGVLGSIGVAALYLLLVRCHSAKVSSCCKQRLPRVVIVPFSQLGKGSPVQCWWPAVNIIVTDCATA